MGNKGSTSVTVSNAGEEGGEAAARKFVLKVTTYCRCKGCTRDAMRGLALAPGVLEVDQSAALATWEVAMLATADPESLRKRVSKVMGKKVDLVFPPNNERSGSGGGSSVREDQAPPPTGHHQYGSYVDAYPPPVPSYYPGPPAPAWVPCVHPAPAPAPPGPYWPSAPRWPGGPGY